MRFSIRLNNDLPLADYLQLAQAAEEAGFDQFWVSHDLFLRSAPVILSALATHTHRIQIGSCILNPYTVNPAEIAMLAATLDELSNCRFNLGLGAGAGSFLQWIGMDQPMPLAAMRESIIAIRALLGGQRVESKGQFLNWTNDAYLRFTAPRVTPIYLAAMSPQMLRLAGELANGVLPLLFPPEHYFTAWEFVQKGLAHRDPALGELDFAACIWASLDSDPAAARLALAQKVAYYGHALSPLILGRLGLIQSDFAPIQKALTVDRNEPLALSLVNDTMLKVGVVGTAHDLITRLQPLVNDGLQHLSFGPPLGPNPLAAIKLIGQEVIPHFNVNQKTQSI